MARPERRNADYFPFYAKDGRTLFLLESKYKCRGTGFFTNVMRFLTLETDHHVNIQDETDRSYFFAKCHCDEEAGLDMLNIMSKTGKINNELWDKKVIASQDHLDSLVDAYRNRKNAIITMAEILQKYVSDVTNPQEFVVSGARNPQESVVSDVDKPQRKLKERKLKETKVIKTPDWLNSDLWKDFLEHRNKLRKPMTEKAKELFFIKLENLKSRGHDPTALIEIAIERGWQTVYEPNSNGDTDNEFRKFREKYQTDVSAVQPQTD